ncbi:polysaccharide pyruvyl transferase family protein [Azospirillum halopraeferens]|uniref:polysaccharide pyruvyl transferase family protein n=1 Tax=Azospirillum halopraeferens TaxID=34010 RepID=UPI00041F105C|nr:polysaccharide pyruvyl transferase family protein [Azospirillum halopraeferens]
MTAPTPFRIYLTGHRSFANHGCEALVRSAVALFRTALGPVEFLVPSVDPAQDARFWPDAAASGVRFVPVVDPPSLFRWWHRAARVAPGWNRLPWPAMPIPPAGRDALAAADLVISTGGDNYTLDYGPVSLYAQSGLDGAAMDRGIPAVLWGASVGPFDGYPGAAEAMRRHLNRFDAVVVRETVTRDYLHRLGVQERLSLSVDPAFLMTPEPVAVTDFWPKEGESGTVALNLSPIIRRYHAERNPGVSMEEDVGAFVHDLVARGYGVLLLPHVVSPDGSNPAKCDHAFLAKLLEHTGTRGGRIALAPRTLNAPQLKHVLSRCRFMMGGRTHATIGALSTGVPTISIAYSVKAKGINRDLFGDERYVLDGADLGRTSLHAAFARLVDEEGEIRRTLAARKPHWPEALEQAVARVCAAVERRRPSVAVAAE